MKLVPFVVCILLVLLVTVPDAQSSRGGVPPSWFENIAGQCGQGLVKNWHYAKCKKRGKIPKELNCPDFAYGCGKGRSDAQKSAKITQIRLEIQGVLNTWDIAKSINTPVAERA